MMNQFRNPNDERQAGRKRGRVWLAPTARFTRRGGEGWQGGMRNEWRTDRVAGNGWTSAGVIPSVVEGSRRVPLTLRLWTAVDAGGYGGHGKTGKKQPPANGSHARSSI